MTPDGIGILHIAAFRKTVTRDGAVPMRRFIDESFRKLSAGKAKALILDLRDNHGGEDELGLQLYSYLAKAPFRYYEKLTVNKLRFDFFRYVEKPEPLPAVQFARASDGTYTYIAHPNSGIHQPAEPHFGGKVFVLMNGGSFSTTAEFLSTASYRRAATFIGEEDGGAFYGNTSGWSYRVVLPHTKLFIDLGVMTYRLAVERDGPADRGVLPDYAISPTVQDLLGGVDREKSFALQLARKVP